MPNQRRCGAVLNSKWKAYQRSGLRVVAASAVVAAVTGLAGRAFAQDAAQVASNSASPEPLPPDLPLPASPPLPAKWLREAIVLQPYAHSQYVALANAGDRPRQLKEVFGFNAIIVQPPDSHNTVAHEADRLTEEQFRTGVAAYRAAGYRLMLYTSVMALGLSPEFQSGAVGRAHPDWLQRDPLGNPVMAWGVPWLCPSTGARASALDRCIRLAHEYKPDGIMLDNNEFFFAEGGWTCHCDACNKAFREYVGRRCGVEGTKRLFGVVPAEIRIPSEEGPLFALWLHWRNRVWAEINESFRSRLREANPEMMLFANTQYGFDTGMLGTDLQYEREDVVLSESCNLSSRQMSAKLVLGHAVAAGRPLWNYIGTFAKADDYTGLQPAATISPWIAATMAHGARPWIVDGFDEGPTDAAARKEMARLLDWQARHPEFSNGEPWAEVGTLISIVSRNVLHRPLIPPHLSALQSAGTPVIALRDNGLTTDNLRPFATITVETATCLSKEAAELLANWVRVGGELLAARDTGTYDELGRKLAKSTLWTALGLDAAPEVETQVGQGSVTAADAGTFARTAIERTSSSSFLVTPNPRIEIVSYRAKQSLLLHLIRHEPTNGHVTLRLPNAIHPIDTTAQQYVPGSKDAKSLPLSVGPEFATIELTEVTAYCVVRIKLR